MIRTSLKQHGLRIGLLLVLVASLLGWLAAHTEVLYADGLRYIRQARTLDRGAWSEGLLKAVDHPVYPLEIVAAHRLLGGVSPDSWQAAAQAASILAGILLVVPLYLVARELFGDGSAWLGSALTYVVPLTGHVFADALSESTFLLFWTWALWTALRFLRAGNSVWLPHTIGLAVLAYLSRPEGLLLPLALTATLVVLPVRRSLTLPPVRWWTAIGAIVIAPACLIAPYVAIKGGIATKPSIARLLGTVPKSPPLAIERSHPLDPDQSVGETYALASKAAFEAVRDAVSIPLLPFSVVGLFLVTRPLRTHGPLLPQTSRQGREWLFLSIVALASVLALVRLHSTGGYCSPRHAMILSLLLIPAAAFGMQQAAAAVGDALARRLHGLARRVIASVVLGLALGGMAWVYTTRTLGPLNEGLGGYRAAGLWLQENVTPGTRVVDVTGWSLFYGGLQGYSFANLAQAPHDPAARWVVAREAHLQGPWLYCSQLRELVGDLQPVAVFHGANRRHPTKVSIFDRGHAESAVSPAVTAPAMGSGTIVR